MRHAIEKGLTVNPTERSTQISSRRTGVFAALRGVFGGRGSGASALGMRLGLVAGCALLAVGLLLPGGADAAFTRPFVGQITTTPSGPFQGPNSVAVDAEDNLWVSDSFPPPAGNGPPYALFEFGKTGIYEKTLSITGLEREVESLKLFTMPQSLAINQATGSFYITGNNTAQDSSGFVEVFDEGGIFSTGWGPLQNAQHVAVDNSTGPTAGTVYVATKADSAAILKFNAEGKPESFGEAGKQSYVSGNEIIGKPDEIFEPSQTHLDVTVDSHGDIYTVNDGAPGDTAYAPEIDEYNPAGLFIRAFTGTETPGLGEQHNLGGFGGTLSGVAIDPVSGDVLVSVSVTVDEHEEGAIDEFDSTGKFLSQITQTSAGKPLRHPADVSVNSEGDLYVVDDGLTAGITTETNGVREHAVDMWGTGRFDPSVKLGEASEAKRESAVLNGSVDPEGLNLSDCHFEYVSEAAYQEDGFADLSSGGSAPCTPSVPVDSEYHAVHATITQHVTSGTTYRYRLVASTSGALGGTAESNVLGFTALAAPRVDSTTVTDVSSEFAELQAQISPLGAGTAYHFEYLTQAVFEANGESFAGPDPAISVPVPDGELGPGGPTGGASESVVRQIGGLAPGTVYRFRVLAGNEIGSTPGEAGTFTTLPEPVQGLPDNRAYELVTPPNKESAGDMFGVKEPEFQKFVNSDVGYASETGDQFFLETNSAFGSSPAAGHNAYVFSRDPKHGTWDSTSLTDPGMGVQSLLVGAFDPFDLSRVGLDDSVGSQAGASGTVGTSLVGPPGGAYEVLHQDAPTQGGSNDVEETRIVGGSRDLDHVVLVSKNHKLVKAAEGQDEGSDALYEYSNGVLSLVNFSSKGALLKCGAVLGASLPSVGGGLAHNAVSADGSRVLFTAPDPEAQNDGVGCWNGVDAGVDTPQLYQRAAGATIEVSAAAPGAPEATRHLAIFVGDSEDGSKVFFISQGELTADDAGIHDPELYEWEAQGTGTCGGSSPAYNPTSKGCLIRVSRGESGQTEGGVSHVPAVSAEGSAVYFLANGVLAANSGADGARAKLGDCGLETGSCNLYRYDTLSGATSYIATVEGTDYPNGLSGPWWNTAEGPQTSSLGQDVALAPTANWYATPDGNYLLFVSRRGLTGYDNEEASGSEPGHECPKIEVESIGNSAGDCDEVYRYDAGSGGSLACLSCDPSGAAPVSNAFFGHSAGLEGVPSAGPVRAMSDDGSYAFFDTADPLVPQDGNGKLDVYEWHEGKVSLISSGQDSANSFFLGASPDGSNVFFGTHARLVPQDTDSSGDVYDARICTESDPCIAPPAGETAQCEGGTCQNPPVEPIDQTPTSLAFAGAGDLVSGLGTPVAPKKAVMKKATAKCRKGLVKKRGKCVPVKRKSKKAKAKRPGNERRAK